MLTDTFNLHTERAGFPRDWLPDNSERAERQQKLPIQVIVGNPPWSVGQRSSADDNPNVDYPELERRVAETYAARSTATLKNSLYDTYKMAIRWASDRIGDQGVIAFVTNGSWIDGNVDSGVRACLAEEFSALYVLNPAGESTDAGRALAPGGGQGVRSGLAGAGCDHGAGAQPGCRTGRLPHPLPRHRGLPHARGEARPLARLERQSRASTTGSRSPPTGTTTGSASATSHSPGSIRWGQRQPRRAAATMPCSGSSATATRPERMRICTTSPAWPAPRMRG